MIGILTPLVIATTPNQMIQDLRNWEAEQNRTPAEESINSSLQELEWVSVGVMRLGFQSSYLKIQYIVTHTPTRSIANIIFTLWTTSLIPIENLDDYAFQVYLT